MVERTAVHSSPQNSALLAALLADDCVHDIARISTIAIISGFSGSMLGSIVGAGRRWTALDGRGVGGEEAGGCWRLEAGHYRGLVAQVAPVCHFVHYRLPSLPTFAWICLDMLGQAWTNAERAESLAGLGQPWTGLDSLG